MTDCLEERYEIFSGEGGAQAGATDIRVPHLETGGDLKHENLAIGRRWIRDR